MIAVATGLGDEGAADEDARPPDQSQPDRFLEAPIEASCIAHGGETSLQRGLDLARDPERDDRGGQGSLRLWVEVGHRQVNMSIEQTGHQNPSLAVDDAGILRPPSRVARMDAFDAAVLDHQPGAGLRVAPGAVEQGRVFEDEGHES